MQYLKDTRSMWSKCTGWKQRVPPGKMEYLPRDKQETDERCVESKKHYLEGPRKRECLPEKNDFVIARISASRAIQFMMSCATPFNIKWLYDHLANQYMTLENDSLSLLYRKIYAANWRFLLHWTKANHTEWQNTGRKTNWPILGIFPLQFG